MDFNLEVFQTNDVGDESTTQNDIFLPPHLKIPILHIPNALTETESDLIANLLLSLEEKIIVDYKMVPVAGVFQGITTRWLEYNLLTMDNVELLPIKREICAAYMLYLKLNKHPRWNNSAQCWGNILREGENLKPHNHNSSFKRMAINGTISLSTMDTETVFHFPFPLLSKKTNELCQFIKFPTKKGQLILIPAWLTHFTTPVPKNEKRITLGFDISDHLVKGVSTPFDNLQNDFYPSPKNSNI